MFSVGDVIVYGSMGVCTVTGVGVPDLPGATRECYILKPHYVANSKVYAPIEANPVKMRPLLTPTEAESLIDSMPGLSPLPPCQEKQAFHDSCRGAIKSADSTALARLLKTLYEKKQRVLEQRKVVPSAEKEYFDTAERMLYGELATALHIPMEEVEDYIDSRVGSPHMPLRAAVS